MTIHAMLSESTMPGVQRRASVYIFIVLTCVAPCYGTRFVYFILPAGIITGMDGKSTVGPGYKNIGKLPAYTKLLTVNGRIVIGQAGLAYLSVPGKNVVVYDFRAWIKGIKSRLRGDESVTEFSTIVEKESRKIVLAINNVGPGILSIGPKDSEKLMQFTILGYEHLAPVGYIVYLDFDGKRLTGPFREQIIPKDGQETNFRLGFAWSDFCSGVLDPLSPGRKRLDMAFPAESMALSTKRDVALPRVAEMVAYILSLEAECDPEIVGPPYTIITIPQFGAAKIDTFEPVGGTLRRSDAAISNPRHRVR